MDLPNLRFVKSSFAHSGETGNPKDCRLEGLTEEVVPFPDLLTPPAAAAR